MEVATFHCSICGEASREICVFCTKDACSNHVCQRCRRCSDCCACEMPVTMASEQAAPLDATEPEPAGQDAEATAPPESEPALEDQPLELVTPAS